MTFCRPFRQMKYQKTSNMYHVDMEAGFQSSKSTIAETGTYGSDLQALEDLAQ